MEERFETFTVLIGKINRNIKKIKNQEMAEYKLKSQHVSCIYYIYSDDTLTAAELCERCDEDKATVSHALEYLEKNGYLVRESRSPKPYKSKILLTDKGKEAGKKITEKINGILDALGLELSEEDRITLYRSLAVINSNLDSIEKRGKRNKN